MPGVLILPKPRIASSLPINPNASQALDGIKSSVAAAITLVPSLTKRGPGRFSELPAPNTLLVSRRSFARIDECSFRQGDFMDR